MNGSNGRAERTGYDGVFKALGDAHRLQILELLSRKELSAGEILESMDIVQSTLSHHMKVLTDSGAVTATRCGKWTVYAVNEAVLRGAEHYLDDFLSRSAHAERSVLLASGAGRKETAEESQTAEKRKENNTKENVIKENNIKENIESERIRKANIDSEGDSNAGTDGAFGDGSPAENAGKSVKDGTAENNEKQENGSTKGKPAKTVKGGAAEKTAIMEKTAKTGKNSSLEKSVKAEEKKKGKKGKKSKKNGKK